MLKINGVDERAARIAREADLVAGKNECFRVGCWKSGEPERKHAASPHSQRYFSACAGVGLRFRHDQLTFRNHSLLPFEIQVSSAKSLRFTRAQTGINTEDKER
ncbi:MAG: hypothetical protein WA721_18500 [Candidatus Binataceae bacterium]